MKWILIIFLFSVDGNQIKSIEYDTETACRNAGQIAIQAMSSHNRISDKSTAYCTQKGNK